MIEDNKRRRIGDPNETVLDAATGEEWEPPEGFKSAFVVSRKRGAQVISLCL